MARSILPEPPDDLKRLSRELQQRLRDVMQADGCISFARFMDMALYEPGLGYYSAGLHKLGAAGDFVTAPELSPLFAEGIARSLLPVLDACSTPSILEFGAGSGRLADITRQADLVIGLGYDPVEFDYEAWLPPVPVVHIDTTAAELSAPYELAALCVGDLDVSLQTLGTMAPLATEWEFDQLARHRDGLNSALRPRSEGFGPSEALDILRATLPSDGILTCDVGAHTHLIGQLWPTPAPGHLLMTNGWSSMGFGIPAALAAATPA